MLYVVHHVMHLLPQNGYIIMISPDCATGCTLKTKV